jgi:HPt (histidine-containing phosphotransfer) domain-containing protein
VAAFEILEDFRSATRADLRLLTQFFDQRDQDSLARQAHRIKGASAMVGARGLAQKLLELEALAKKGEWSDVHSLMSQVQDAFEGLATVE